jgi:hypothetical protein
VVVADKPDDATIHRFAEIVNFYATLTVTAVVSNARVQVAVVEPTSEVPGGLPISLHPVPHVVLRTVPGVVPEEEALALLQAPLLPSARLPAPVTVWGQLTLLRPEDEPEVEESKEVPAAEPGAPAVGGAPVARGPPSDPPGAYTLAGRWQWGATGFALEGVVCGVCGVWCVGCGVWGLVSVMFNQPLDASLVLCVEALWWSCIFVCAALWCTVVPHVQACCVCMA